MEKKGFTFIETLVVVLTLALIVPTIFTIVFTILRGQTKTIRLSQSKREGDYALNLITNTIRNRAISIYSGIPPSDSNIVCDSVGLTYNGSSLYFQDEAGKSFGYLLNADNTIATSSSTYALTSLTSTNTYVENFGIGCENKSSYGNPLITISFDICFKTASGNCSTSRPEESSTLQYSTKIRLRSH